jgi:hypothetical protein
MEESESQVVATSAQDLENGIFNMVISLAQYFMVQGWTKEQACEKVAEYLLQLVEGLRQQ